MTFLCCHIAIWNFLLVYGLLSYNWVTSCPFSNYLNVRPFDKTVVAGSEKVGSVNRLTLPVWWP